MHALGMNEREAMALMTGRGHQEQSEAAGKWRRALLTSAQLSTYHVGHAEMADTISALKARDRQANGVSFTIRSSPTGHRPLATWAHSCTSTPPEESGHGMPWRSRTLSALGANMSV